MASVQYFALPLHGKIRQEMTVLKVKRQLCFERLTVSYVELFVLINCIFDSCYTQQSDTQTLRMPKATG